MIFIPFDTFAGSTGASATMSGLAVGDIRIYKNGSTTERASTSGFTLLDTDGTDFDSITGLQGISIDLADNTTSGFYTAGGRYMVAIASITVDGQTVNFWAARFDIGYPDALINTTIASLSSQTSFTLATAPAEANALVGCPVIVHDIASAVQLAYGIVVAYAATTKTVTLLTAPTFTVTAGDNISVYPPANSRWIGAALPSAATIGTVTTLANLPTIPADWITAAGIAADAVAEMQSGLATAATQTTILNRIGSFAGSGVNTILGFFQALARSDASTPSDLGGTYDPSTDSAQAIRDRGDAAWATGGGGSISDILNVTPLIPAKLSIADTVSWRLGLMLVNVLDDLPSTAEITPGTISIDRKQPDATSWTAVVTDAACSELAGLIYYDEVFDSATGYLDNDFLRITFKSQKITVAANDYEISDTNGRVFYTYIQAIYPKVNVWQILDSDDLGDGLGQLSQAYFDNGYLSADLWALNGDGVPATNLYNTYNGIGYSNDRAPATQEDMLKYFAAIARGDAAAMTDLSVVIAGLNTDWGSGAGSYDNTIGSLQASQAGYTAPDNASIAAILADTAALDALLAELTEDDGGGNQRYTSKALENAPGGGGLTLADIADAVLDEVVENGAPANAQTLRQLVRLIVAAMFGKSGIDEDGQTVRFRDLADSKDRIVGQIDSSGYRTDIDTLDGS